MASTISPAEIAFNAACQAYKDAERAFTRSRSVKNRATFIVARDAHGVAADAWRAEQVAEERAATVARRLALVAPRRAAAAAQGSLFG